MGDSLFHDIRYAVRTLRRAPLFVATVAATMGLGLGLLGSAFTFLNRLPPEAHRPAGPARVVRGELGYRTTRRQRFRRADYEALQREAQHFSQLAAAQDVTVMEELVATRGMLVTGNYFEMLGARPAGPTMSRSCGRLWPRGSCRHSR